MTEQSTRTHSSPTSALRTTAVKRAFASGAGAKVLSVACGFLSIAIAVRAQGDEAFGVVAALVGVVGAVGFLDFGIGNLAIGMIARSHAAGDRRRLDRETASIAAFLLLMGLLAAVVLVPLVFVAPLPELFNAPGTARATLVLSALVFVLATAVSIPASLGSKIALGMQRGTMNNAVLAFSSASVTVGVTLAAWVRAPLPVFVAIFVGLPVLWNLGQSAVVLSAAQSGPVLRLDEVDPKLVKALVPRGVPFAALGIAGAVSYQTDAFVVSAVLGAAAATTYALPLRLFNGVPTIFSGGLQQLWASTAHALEEGDLDWVRRNFLRTLVITMSVFGALIAALIVTGPFLISLWSGGHVLVGVPVLAVFGLWALYSFFMSQLSMLLNGGGKVGAQAVAAILMAVTNLPLSIWLTTSWGVTGPLWGSLITHGVFVGLPTIWMSVRLLRGDYLPRGRSAGVALAG